MRRGSRKRLVAAAIVIGVGAVAGWFGGVRGDSGSSAGNSPLLSMVAVGSASSAGQEATERAAGNPRKPSGDDKPTLKETKKELKHDVSAPLRSIPPAESPNTKKQAKAEHVLPPPPEGSSPDTVVQVSVGGLAAPVAGTSFDGVGQGFSGPQGTFSVRYAPPDTNGAVGPNHYFQIVNDHFAIFDKTGTVVYGPVPSNTLWSGFGGGCQNNNDGDATVVYDGLANRWVVQQFSVSTTPYLECVAVSTTGDPTGSYARYSFSFGNQFPDYPKLGVWPDGYYLTVNDFLNGGSFSGPQMCALNRAKMLAGQLATSQCFSLSTSHGSLLPADLDGLTPPPAGAPNPMLEFGSNSLLLWRFHVDWATPANSTFAGLTVPVAAFSPACSGGGACIPQPSTTQKLDSLADRLMYRLAYRNFGDHESLVVNHSVTAGSSVGVRWYELRDPNGTPTVYQQGTYAPDTSYRWMGSVAMDGNGDIGLGYSVSSSAVRPGIRYTAHSVSDPLGVMGQGEGVLVNGTGSQTQSLNRWGDYSSLNIDPADDCTFWFTSEYLTTNGTWNWHTRIGTFKVSGCGTTPTPNFSLSASPSSSTVTAGQATSYAVTLTPSGGFNGAADLSVSGLPAGVNGSFSPNPVSSTSTLTVTTSTSTPAGSYPLTITGTSGTLSHQASVTLVVQGLTPDFSVSASPTTSTVSRGGSTTYGVTITRINGFSGSVTLSLTGLPGRTSSSFSPNPTTTSSTLTVFTQRNTIKGSYTLTIRGTNGSLVRSTTVTLVIQ
jgi:hypothetical protein